MNEVIETVVGWRESGFRITAYDMGDQHQAKLVLGLKIDDPVDIWYAYEMGLTPAFDAKQGILYFPQIELTPELYAEVVGGKS